MTRKRDIQRRFLEKRGWAFHRLFNDWWHWCLTSNSGLNREEAFRREMNKVSASERRELNRRLRNAE